VTIKDDDDGNSSLMPPCNDGNHILLLNCGLGQLHVEHLCAQNFTVYLQQW